MAGEATKIIIVAQAEGGDALQEGVVVTEELVQAELHEDGIDPAAAETHAETEAHAEVFPPFDPATYGNQLLWLALTFAFLYFLMSRVALPRIGGILESRRTRIEGDLKEADRLRVETDRAAAAYEEALAQARANAHAIAEETRQGIRSDIEGKRATVESDLSSKIAEADAAITKTKETALGNVEDIAAETAAALVGQLADKVSTEEARAAVAAVAKG
jgi:F-type H+-transporting ATPase subunit b